MVQMQIRYALAIMVKIMYVLILLMVGALGVGNLIEKDEEDRKWIRGMFRICIVYTFIAVMFDLACVRGF